MKEQDRYMLVEMFFTSCLLCSAAFLVERQVSFYSPLLAIGLVCGFCFSWLSRNRSIAWLNSAIGISAVIVLAWLAFSVFNSSFVYREVVALCMKGMIVLIIVLCFNAGSPRVISDIQILSLPLFMSHAVWLRQYSGINAFMVLAYLVSGLIVLKIKFRGSFKNASPEFLQRDRSVLILVFFFLCSVGGAWLIASNYKNANLSGGVLREAGTGGNVRVDDLDKRYYELQDTLQEQIKSLMLRSGPGKENTEVFSALSVLLNQEGSVLDLDKAEQSLVDFIKGSGNARGDELVTLERSLDRKIASNSGKIREDINNSLKKDPFNVKERMDLLNQVDRLSSRDSSQELSEAQRHAQDMIRKSSFDPRLKKEIDESVSALKDWETLALYRRKNKLARGKIEYLKKELKEKMSKVLKEVNKAREPADPGKAGAELEKLEKTLTDEAKGLLKEIKETLDLKSDMIISEGLKRAKENIKSADLPGKDLRGLEKGIDDLKKSEDARDFLKKHEELTRALEAGGLQSDKIMNESVGAMRERFAGQKKGSISASLKKSNLPDGGEKIMKSVQDMASAKTSKELDSSAAKAKSQLDDAGKKGFISEESRDGLKKDIDELGGLMKARNDFDAQGKQDKSRSEDAVRSKIQDIKEDLKQGRAESAEKVMKPVQDMASAKTSKELDSSAAQAQEQVDDAVKNGGLPENVKDGVKNKINDLLGMLKAGKTPELPDKQDEAKTGEDIRSKIEEINTSLKNSDLPDSGEKIMKSVQDMASAKTSKELDSSAAKAKDQAADARKKGLISEESRDGLEKAIDQLNGMMKSQKDMPDRGEQDSSLSESEIRSKIDSIKAGLEKSDLPDSGEKIMNSVQDMASAPAEQELDASTAAAQDLVQAAGQKGLISEEAQNGLAADIEDLNGLLAQRFNPGRQESLDEESAGDHQDGMLASIKGSALDEDDKKKLSGLTEELFKAQTIARMEALQAEVEEQAKASGKSDAQKEWLKKFSGDFQEMKSLQKMIKSAEKGSKLKDQLEKLQSIDPEKADGMAQDMESMVKSDTDEDLEKNVRQFSRELENNRNISPKLTSLATGKKADFQIDLLPRSVVITQGGSVYLRPVAVYGGAYIRDIRAELEWVSLDPLIAAVDQKGAVTALSPGEAEIFCRHKGVESQKTKIKVTAEIEDNVYKKLKNELKK